MEKLFIYYLIAINLISFFGMGWDKYLATKNKWRTPEASLFTVAFLGGALGSILGMQLFRHKTKKTLFKFGMPTLLIINIICIYFFITGDILS